MSYFKMLAIELFISTLCVQAWAVVGGIAFEDLPEVASKKLIRSTVRFLLSTKELVRTEFFDEIGVTPASSIPLRA